MRNEQSVNGTGHGLSMQHFQFPHLFRGQCRVGDTAQLREEVGHQSRFSGRPLALKCSLHGRQRLVRMGARLIEQLRGAPLDSQFQQIECPMIDRRIRPFSHLGQIRHQRIDRRFLAKFG